MTCPAAVTYAKRCIGLGWARTFSCTLAGAGDPATTMVKAASMLICSSLGKALQVL